MDSNWIAKRLGDRSTLMRRLALAQAENILRAGRAIASALAQGNSLLLFGNGGSAADAQHLAAEFIGRFRRDRIPLPALALTTDSSILTAIGNDFGFDQVFARQVQALGKTGDVALATSTSGQSPNVLEGVKTARERGMITIGLTGGDGGALAGLVDIALVVPEKETALVQECHLAMGHLFCEIVESQLFPEHITLPRLEGPVAPPLKTGEKAVDLATLLALRESWRAEGKTVVWTNGCFDLLHIGHVRNLQAAKALGDVLVIGVNGDVSVRQLKGPRRPLVPAVERAELLAALSCVNHVVIFEELTPETYLAQLQPDIHCKGADYAPPAGKPIPEAQIVASYGGRIAFLPFIQGHSTSDLAQRMCRQ